MLLWLWLKVIEYKNMENKVLVTAIIATDESFATALGITKEREEELDNAMDKCHAETETYPDALAKLTASLDITANELAYAAFHIGAYAESLRTRNSLLNKLLD